MSDDLIERLLANALDECDEAAARLEALEAENEQLREAADMVARTYTAEDYTERSLEYKLGEKCRAALYASRPRQKTST